MEHQVAEINNRTILNKIQIEELKHKVGELQWYLGMSVLVDVAILLIVWGK